MNEISIIQAWTLWLTDHLSPHMTIWGVSIFWWGRIGKMMQFVGAITIIADIIGPEQIRRFGTSLHNVIAPTSLIQFLQNCFDWYTVICRHTLMKDYVDETSETTPEKGKPKRYQLDFLNYFICLLLTVLIISLIKLPFANWVFLIEFGIIYGCLLISVSPLVTVLIVLLLILLGLVINSGLIKPLAWVLEHPSLDRFTKVVSLLFLLIGFHFELLTS